MATNRIDENETDIQQNTSASNLKKITISFIQENDKTYLNRYSIAPIPENIAKFYTDKLNPDTLLIDKNVKNDLKNLKVKPETVHFYPDNSLEDNELRNVLNRDSLSESNEREDNSDTTTSNGGYDAFKVIPSKKTRKTIKKVKHFTLKKFSKKSRMSF
jgi:hypothetical protein